jgi:hypothetical protein
LKAKEKKYSTYTNGKDIGWEFVMEELNSLELPIALYCNNHQAVEFVTKWDNGVQFSRLPALRMRLFDHHPPSQASRCLFINGIRAEVDEVHIPRQVCLPLKHGHPRM